MSGTSDNNVGLTPSSITIGPDGEVIITDPDFTQLIRETLALTPTLETGEADPVLAIPLGLNVFCSNKKKC